METNVNNPLVIRCKNCGGAQSFDITKQQYVCEHCGSTSELDSQKAEFKNWRQIQQQKIRQDLGNVRAFACPACGARTLAAADDASAACPFCQNTMIDAEFAGTDLPEIIIPFKITKEEAETKLKAWLAENKSNKAAKVIEDNLKRFTGCYLPYHIVRGAYNGDMEIIDQETANHYPFKAYLSHTAVNASQDWDNLFLDGIEPFDYDDARAFDFSLLNRQNAKIQNVEGEALKERIKEETHAELYDDLSQKVKNKEVSIHLDDDNNESIPTLMPVYLVKCDNGIAAAVNGQTGKVSVATGKQKNLTGRWWLVPTLATLAVIIAGTIWGTTKADFQSGLETGFGIGLVFAIIFFLVAHGRHHKEVINEVLTYPETEKGHNDTQTEFFADFGKGMVPAVLKFFTTGRIIKVVLGLLAVIFLPVLIAIPIQLFRGASLLDLHVGSGLVWYIVFGFFGLLAAGGLAKTMMYGYPMYYEIKSDGTLKRRKPVNRENPTMRRILQYLRPKSKKGKQKTNYFAIIFMVVFLVVTLVMSVLGILGRINI